MIDAVKLSMNNSGPTTESPTHRSARERSNREPPGRNLQSPTAGGTGSLGGTEAAGLNAGGLGLHGGAKLPPLSISTHPTTGNGNTGESSPTRLELGGNARDSQKSKEEQKPDGKKRPRMNEW
jgi:hypothetical protein